MPEIPKKLGLIMTNVILAEIRNKSISPYCRLSDRGLEAVFAGFFDIIRLNAGDSIALGTHSHRYTSVIRGAITVDGADNREGKRFDAFASASGPLVLSQGDGDLRLRALEPTLLLSGDGDVIDDIVSIDTLVSGRGIEADIVQLILMRQSKGFAGLPTEALVNVYERMTPVIVEAGEDVVRQDMKGDSFYFLRHGCAEVWREELEDDEPRHVATLGSGDCFGEEALILGGARNATVRMITPGELLSLDGDSYNELVAKPSVARISIDEAKAKIAAGAHLVDVRYQDEWDDGHLPGAVHIPLSVLRARVGEVTPDREVVVYCRSGRRSQVGAFLMAQNGFTAYSMDGGINGWTDDIVRPNLQ